MATIKAYTDLEQSKKLLELGLNPESADMYWFRDDTEKPKVFPKYMMHDSVSVTYPCWSVGALFEVMPSVIKSHNKKYYLTYLRLRENRHYIYYLSSDPYRGIEERLELTYPDGCNTFNIFGETMIEAAYEMVVWLLENNYIKKGE